MNIFYLDNDPRKAAEYMCDKHVVKMVLETAQLLCTAHHVLGKSLDKKLLYKKTHQNHPCAVWVRSSLEAYRWTYDHFVALCDEYTYRFKGRIHLTDRKFRKLLETHPDGIPDAKLTSPPQCMPEEFKGWHTPDAYRRYYKFGKAKSLHKWTKRGEPFWFSEWRKTNTVDAWGEGQTLYKRKSKPAPETPVYSEIEEAML